jgi:hypothetical protein
MATIKQLVGTDRAEQLYALKDSLQAERILDRNPMKLNRTQFKRYMSAKAEALIIENTQNGGEIKDAFRKAEMYLTLLDSRWREAAKDHNTVLHPKLDMVDMVTP